MQSTFVCIPNSEINLFTVANSKNIFLKDRKELLWFGLFPFLFILQILGYAGQARISCCTSEALKDELVQNSSSLS